MLLKGYCVLLSAGCERVHHRSLVGERRRYQLVAAPGEDCEVREIRARKLIGGENNMQLYSTLLLFEAHGN